MPYDKTTKPFDITPAQIETLRVAEATMEEIGRSFVAANPNYGDFELSLKLELVHDYDAGWNEEKKVYGKKAKAEYRIGGWCSDRGEGKTLERAVQHLHERTDADRHRERAKTLRHEADRLEREADDIQGTPKKRRDDE